MTRYDISHWTITDGKTGLLLFAQSLEELLAMHSHDSHKVPALNFHYLGYEILSVIDSVEDDVLDIVDTFFSYFPASQHDYVVYFPLNSIKQKRALEDYGNFEIAENVYEMFDPSIPYILKYTCIAIDPYRAREQGLQLINFCLSANQFIRHNKYDYSPKYAEVVNKENKAVTFIKRPETPIFRGYANYTSLEVNDLLDTCLKLNAGVFQVLQLHSAALISKNTDNQLINLWTAIEVAIPITRKDSLSRINQISNILLNQLKMRTKHIPNAYHNR